VLCCVSLHIIVHSVLTIISRISLLLALDHGRDPSGATPVRSYSPPPYNSDGSPVPMEEEDTHQDSNTNASPQGNNTNAGPQGSNTSPKIEETATQALSDTAFAARFAVNDVESSDSESLASVNSDFNIYENNKNYFPPHAMTAIIDGPTFTGNFSDKNDADAAAAKILLGDYEGSSSSPQRPSNNDESPT